MLMAFAMGAVATTPPDWEPLLEQASWQCAGCAVVQSPCWGVRPVRTGQDVSTRPHHHDGSRDIRDDPTRYDELAHLWWDRRGPFAMLQWIVGARSTFIPPATRPAAVLLDVACGGGLLAPHICGLGYRHVGVDLSMPSLTVARHHAVHAVCGDARTLPVPDETVDVVVAGECLEHVSDPAGVVAELCRVLRPHGILVLDTIASTLLARFVAGYLVERLPGGPPRGLHDPELFVDRRWLIEECQRHGVALRLFGLRPSVSAWLAWLVGRRSTARMVTTRSTAVLFGGVGVKSG